ncbi:MAG: sigma-54 dependent transcriptional regulator [Nitrospira sp.]|nr:sigma-54 dependent transcriptional regulator [Nitrospira sp.]
MILLALVYLPLTIYTFHEGLITPILPPILAIGLTYVSALLYQNRLSRKHIEALTDDKEQIGKTLREVTQALRENEIELIKSREELSHLICTMDQIRDREQEKLERIRYLETALEQVGVLQDDLLNKKWILEEKVADLVAVPVREDESINMEWKILQREFARHGVITYSAKIFKVFDMAKKVAVTNEPVLIQGETGTGKELFARAIHAMSPRSQRPFVTINTPALPDNLIESELFGHLKGSFTGAVTDKKGKFQVADGGTIFLDEIGELRPDLQAKLLRVLQNGEVDRVGANSPIRVDVRIIAATNRDLQAEVRGRLFRNDLYFRLNVVSINLPSLRERLEDIEVLSDYFLKKHILESGRKIKGISQKALEMLKRHSWPGNVRELENVISRGVIMTRGDWITEDDLELTEAVMIHPEQKNFTEDYIEAIEEGEPLSDKAFLAILRENEFEIWRTAQQLNMSRGTVGSRFKGISFKVLAQCGGDFTQATREIAADSRAFDLVERRVHEYYENLIQVIHGYDNFDEAIQECHRRFKNLQERYIGSLDLLVRKYFGQTVTKR